MFVAVACLVGLVAVAIVAAVVWSASRRAEAQLSSVRQEMQQSLAAQSQAVSAQVSQQVGHLMQTVTQQLGQVRQELQSGVASSAQLTSDAQRQVSAQLAAVNQKIGEMQQSSQDLAKASSALQSILGGAKTRGTLGEAALDRLLADALPQDAYSTQFRFASTGAIVDAVLHNGDRLLPIDSKFPLEAYRRLAEMGEDARREFSMAVRKHADSIAEKYILPHEHTLDYALMFVPSEGVYYELLMTADSKYGPLDEYCRGIKVFPVSPNTLYAMLSAVCVSLKGQRLEENARHLLAALAGLRKHLDSFEDAHDKVGTHLRHAQQSYEDAASRFQKMANSFEQISQNALIQDADASLEPAPLEPFQHELPK
jgi:DNA recombination protein RmuC